MATTPPAAPRSEGPYAIGSNHWPGVSKLVEELGEVGQVLGKLVAVNGAPDHWDGSNLHTRLEEELGDLLAAIHFLKDVNPVLDYERIHARMEAKRTLFHKWHAGDDAARMSSPTPKESP